MIHSAQFILGYLCGQAVVLIALSLFRHKPHRKRSRTAIGGYLELRDNEGIPVMQLVDSQPGSYVFTPEDAALFPTSLDPAAVPTWSISDPTVATITPSGLTCAVQPLKPGSAVVQISIPAVNAEPALLFQDTLTVIAGTAVTGVLVGTPGPLPTSAAPAAPAAPSS